MSSATPGNLPRCFNSRAHGGRDAPRRLHGRPHRRVSIHAPTGGATAEAQDKLAALLVSIHAPTGGATRRDVRQVGRRGFNSRAHGGRDQSPKWRAKEREAFQFTRPRGARHLVLARTKSAATVSIHAPTGGATSITGYLKRRLEFQFTRPRGARRNPLAVQLVRPVSIHAPTGGATDPRFAKIKEDRFQFTRPRGARHANVFGGFRTHGFNSRAHGGRDQCSGAPHPSAAVSIHAPTGGATTRSRPWAWPARFQFTRPRGARPVGRIEVGRTRRVSIHAPTGGATRGGCRVAEEEDVSIHAPTGGATSSDPETGWESLFQFTRPRGARLDLYVGVVRRAVSIHAPTGGATPIRRRARAGGRFNSRAHGGRDPHGGRLQRTDQFQFTRPRGARRAYGWTYRTTARFNSRAHGGRDRRPRLTTSRTGRFNSRAHGGRDSFRRPARTASRVSIHAPTGGATRIDDAALANDRFNSRAHGGRDSTA